MTTISHLFNRSIIIKRLKTTSGNKRTFVSTGTIDGHIQRVDDRTSSAAQDVYGATHKAWVDVSAPVHDGDNVTIQGVDYSVVAVIDKEPDVAMNEHRTLMLRKYSA